MLAHDMDDAPDSDPALLTTLEPSHFRSPL
jgi:hypothetical protein